MSDYAKLAPFAWQNVWVSSPLGVGRCALNSNIVGSGNNRRISTPIKTMLTKLWFSPKPTTKGKSAHSLCSAARSRCRRFLNQFDIWNAKKNFVNCRQKLSFSGMPYQSIAWIRLAFAFALCTCMVVRPVPSASSRFSRGDGYGLWAYHSRRIERDFSLKQ